MTFAVANRKLLRRVGSVKEEEKVGVERGEGTERGTDCFSLSLTLFVLRLFASCRCFYAGAAHYKFVDAAYLGLSLWFKLGLGLCLLPGRMRWVRFPLLPLLPVASCLPVSAAFYAYSSSQVAFFAFHAKLV